MQGITVSRVTFDSMENRINRAVNTTVLATFVTDDRTAYDKADEFIRKREPEMLYLGWDLQVYPQFRVQECTIT